MNLTRVFLDSAPVRERLSFGVNKNVFLRAVSSESRKDKDGNKSKKNCFITFSKIDPKKDNKVIGEHTFSFFELGKAEYAADGLIAHMNHLVAIMSQVIPEGEFEEAFDKVISPLENEKVEKELLAKKVKKIKLLQKAQEEMVKIFAEEMEEYCGDISNLFSLLVVTDRSGKFVELPRESGGFIDDNDSKKLAVGSKYKRWYLDGLKPDTDDADDIGDDDIIEDDDIILDEDDTLDDI